MSTLDSLIVELRADISGLTSSLQTASNDVKKFSDKADKDVDSLSEAFGRVKTTILALGSAWAAFNAGKEIVDAGIQIQALGYRMTAATGDAKIAAEALAFVRAESDRLGLSFVSSAGSFASFSASALRSGMTFQQTKDVFTGVAEAVTALHLPAAQAASAFLAIEQMASKGTVQMQELKLQLASAIPGSMEIMAKASGVSVQKFNELISKGDVLASDALPKLAAAFREQFGAQAMEAADGAQAAFNRLDNSLTDLKSKLADSGFLDAITKSVKDLTAAISDPAAVEGLKGFVQMMGDIATEATKAAIAVGTLYETAEKNRQALLAATKDKSAFSFVDPATILADAKETVDLRARVLAQFAAQQKAASKGQGTDASGSYTLGSTTQEETDAQKAAREKAERLREQLRNQVNSIKTTNARETDPATAAALDIDKQQKTLKEALDKKAITEGEYRDASLQAEEAYQQKLTDIRQKASDLEVNMRDKALDNIMGLLQVFAGKNKAIAIAMLAFDKARAIAQAIMETHVAAAAALKYDPTGTTSAYVTTLGYANVAAIAATGIAQLAMMGSSGGSGGSGSSSSSVSGGSSSSSASSTSTAAPASQKSVFITLNGDDATLYSKNNIRKLINSINDAISDGSQLKVAVS